MFEVTGDIFAAEDRRKFFIFVLQNDPEQTFDYVAGFMGKKPLTDHNLSLHVPYMYFCDFTMLLGFNLDILEKEPLIDEADDTESIQKKADDNNEYVTFKNMKDIKRELVRDGLGAQS